MYKKKKKEERKVCVYSVTIGRIMGPDAPIKKKKHTQKKAHH